MGFAGHHLGFSWHYQFCAKTYTQTGLHLDCAGLSVACAWLHLPCAWLHLPPAWLHVPPSVSASYDSQDHCQMQETSNTIKINTRNTFGKYDTCGVTLQLGQVRFMVPCFHFVQSMPTTAGCASVLHLVQPSPEQFYSCVQFSTLRCYLEMPANGVG